MLYRELAKFRTYIGLSAALLIGSGILGLCVALTVDPSSGGAAIESAQVSSAQTTDAQSSPGVFHFIVRNGTVISLIAAGAVLFASTTIFGLLFNGYLLGYQIGAAATSNHILYVGAAIVPHGLFEIPAILLAGAAGFLIPGEIIKYLLGRRETPVARRDFRQTVFLTALSVLCVIAAAIVEAVVTPRLINAVN